jgi:hypothetical protein
MHSHRGQAGQLHGYLHRKGIARQARTFARISDSMVRKGTGILPSIQLWYFGR